MIFFDQIEYAKIPIWENKRRIKALSVCRDLYIDRLTNHPGCHRRDINQQIPAVREMVDLAGIAAERSWPTMRDGYPSTPEDIDVLAEIWDLNLYHVNQNAPIDVIDNAIGVYRKDQAKSWFRTFWPFFWLGRLIDWVAHWTFNVVALFGADPHEARSSHFGRVITALERLTLWTATVVGAAIAVLEFLGFETPIRHFLNLP
jgi:hypothetical protein